MIDLTFNSKQKPQKGALLIADPFAGDDFFTRSVVLLCDHNDDGSFGFVVNNYLDIDLHTLIPDFPKLSSKIGIGGPVDRESIFYIHSFGEKISKSVAIGESLYFGGDFEDIVAILKEDPTTESNIRFFLGYSGWSSNQLNEEMEKHAWIVTSTYQKEEILDTNELELWKKLMTKQGKKFKLMTDFPLNPMNN